MLEADKKREMFEAAFLQMHFCTEGYYCIYVDEFHINMITKSVQNWSRRGSSASLVVSADSWTMSFVLAISEKRFEGIMASNQSIRMKTFGWFIKNVWRAL
jgi:hypothetical protein